MGRRQDQGVYAYRVGPLFAYVKNDIQLVIISGQNRLPSNGYHLGRCSGPASDVSATMGRIGRRWHFYGGV